MMLLKDDEIKEKEDNSNDEIKLNFPIIANNWLGIFKESKNDPLLMRSQ